jgi:hypothetical protein
MIPVEGTGGKPRAFHGVLRRDMSGAVIPRECGFQPVPEPRLSGRGKPQGSRTDNGHQDGQGEQQRNRAVRKRKV